MNHIFHKKCRRLVTDSIDPVRADILDALGTTCPQSSARRKIGRHKFPLPAVCADILRTVKNQLNPVAELLDIFQISLIIIQGFRLFGRRQRLTDFPAAVFEQIHIKLICP